ncbi:MAG: DUF4374 domain-containing protein [Mediterranea sp.]|jgi:hypothetical protein|nr:DUF4374 domain-containing protein [Mediterranea sp.]
MKKNFLFWPLASLFCAACVFTACDDENDGHSVVARGEYVVAATVDGVNYLPTVESLDEGNVSLANNGLETEAGTYWVFHGTEYLFRLVYNKGGAGTGASYVLGDDGKVKQAKTYDFSRITTYGSWGDNVITSSTGDTNKKDAEGNIAQGFLVNYLSATDGTVETKTYDAENYLDNGEYVCFSGFVQANGKLYTSVVPMGMSKYGIAAHPDKVLNEKYITTGTGGGGSGTYGEGVIPSTQYPDNAYIAIYSGSSFDEKPVIVSTDKIGFASGRMRSQYYQTIWAAGNGDLYVFSPGFGRTTVSNPEVDGFEKVEGKLSSGVMRIKASATAFDNDYGVVAIEELENKHPLYRCWHITEDYFLLQLYTQGLDIMAAGTTELAVFKGEAKTLKIVTGLPDEDILASIGNNPYSENGYIYVPITTTIGNPALYKIDPKTAKATKGLTIEAETINAVGKLTYNK